MKIIFYLFILLTSKILGQSIELPINMQEVAKAFGVSETDINIIDKTNEVRNKYGDAVYYACIFEIKSDSNVSIQLIVTKARFLLSRELSNKLEKKSEFIKKVNLEYNGFGFIGIEGIGPGSEGSVSIAHLPIQDIDFKLRVIISNDGTSASDTSLNSVFRNSESLINALEKITIAINNNLNKKYNNSSNLEQDGINVKIKPKSPPQSDFKIANTENKYIYSLIFFGIAVGLIMVVTIIFRIKNK